MAAAKKEAEIFSFLVHAPVMDGNVVRGSYFQVMNVIPESSKIVLENLWGADVSGVRDEVLALWKRNGGPMGDAARERLGQIVFVLRDPSGRIVGLSTAFKAYVKKLRNHFFVFRLMIDSDYRIPGLTSRLLVSTRDFLESIHQLEGNDPPIGLITLVQNDQLKTSRNEAVWPASKMVYIGNSREGHPIRVYYFRGARILP